jgi:hypothetical protein
MLMPSVTMLSVKIKSIMLNVVGLIDGLRIHSKFVDAYAKVTNLRV